jgi:pilus assembly protein CpaB
LVVVLALVFGVTAAYFINAVLSNRAPAAPPDTVRVVVAAADTPRFATLSTHQLDTKDCPKDLVPPGALTLPEDAVNRVTLHPLVKGEVVLEGKLAPKGVRGGMAHSVSMGKRAFTIQTPTVASSVAGFVLPGNKVDVLLAVGQNGNDSVAHTLVQNVEILAVDQRVDAPADNKVDLKELRSVTLSVTPDEVARLDLGQKLGTLHLALRNPEDDKPAVVRRANLATIGLVEEQPKAVEPEPPPPPVQIRTFRGTREGAVLVYPARSATTARR